MVHQCPYALNTLTTQQRRNRAILGEKCHFCVNRTEQRRSNSHLLKERINIFHQVKEEQTLYSTGLMGCGKCALICSFLFIHPHSNLSSFYSLPISYQAFTNSLSLSMVTSSAFNVDVSREVSEPGTEGGQASHPQIHYNRILIILNYSYLGKKKYKDTPSYVSLKAGKKSPCEKCPPHHRK